MKFVSTLLVLAFSTSAFAVIQQVPQEKNSIYIEAIRDGIAASSLKQCAHSTSNYSIDMMSIYNLLLGGIVSIDTSGSQPVLTVSDREGGLLVLSVTTSSDYKRVSQFVLRKYENKEVNQGTLIAPSYATVRSQVESFACVDNSATSSSASLK